MKLRNRISAHVANSDIWALYTKETFTHNLAILKFILSEKSLYIAMIIIIIFDCEILNKVFLDKECEINNCNKICIL